jgi:hypothetical protein
MYSKYGTVYNTHCPAIHNTHPVKLSTPGYVLQHTFIKSHVNTIPCCILPPLPGILSCRCNSEAGGNGTDATATVNLGTFYTPSSYIYTHTYITFIGKHISRRLDCTMLIVGRWLGIKLDNETFEMLSSHDVFISGNSRVKIILNNEI